MDRLQLTHEDHNKIRRPYCGLSCMRLGGTASDLVCTRPAFATHMTGRQVDKGALNIFNWPDHVREYTKAAYCLRIYGPPKGNNGTMFTSRL